MSILKIFPFAILVASLFLSQTVHACRINSEKLKIYAQQAVGILLNSRDLESIYWPNEPLDSSAITKATGINVTLAETAFKLTENGSMPDDTKSDSLIKDISISCSIDKDRSYALIINLELDNPFKRIDLNYEIPAAAIKRESNDLVASGPLKISNELGRFRIHLPQSTFLVQLNQRIRYDECILINYVQLSPSVSYDIECASCDPVQQKHLDKVFSKRMNQFDAELDSLLSDKIMLGLQYLLTQQRLDLELFMD